ncbi:MAG TPA: 50S ribosomal protein L15 [Fusobacteriaceae bacterium]|nr:50S ribosomal protein L15 [Fusobacteriaceae bacterium]
MKLNELQPSVPRKDRKRVGRGMSSGTGKTSGKGHNGQKSRSGSGSSLRAGFEGGQMPLIRRVPKRGFSNFRFKKDFAIIDLNVLNLFEAGTEISPIMLVEAGIIKNVKSGIKLLGNGTLDKSVTVIVNKVSASAQAAVEANGGTVVVHTVKTFKENAGNTEKHTNKTANKTA